MWRWVLVFVVALVSAAEAGQVRSSFQVGLTITGPPNRSAAPAQTRLSTVSVPLPRARPADRSIPLASQAPAALPQ